MSKPDFTGTWRFDPARSSLQIQLPEAVTFEIQHHEPRFRLSRTLVIGGASDTIAIDLTTDGRLVVCHHRGMDITARLNWDGQALLFHSSLTRAGEQAENTVRYLLADQDQTFIAEEKFRGRELQYDNRWVFERPS